VERFVEGLLYGLETPLAKGFLQDAFLFWFKFDRIAIPYPRLCQPSIPSSHGGRAQHSAAPRYLSNRMYSSCGPIQNHVKTFPSRMARAR
jgi:hypothetical protein